MKTLPYRIETGTGDIFDVEFPLHKETGEPVRVEQLVSQLLRTIDRELALFSDTSNGDVLQAVAMVLATRARMVHANSDVTGQLATQLLSTALKAVSEASRKVPQTGHA